ncbi:MAG TPA: Co2+/Mg2+ efflux protein ApaG [Bacteroidia bacterium]|nr:Co2+/Mg2+ efflux protein ApaG [Bacteroidia bacterium]
MSTCVTHNIKISAVSTYQDLYSRPEMSNFYFSYRIRIENNSEDTVQLMRRHWYIFDGTGEKSEVEGEGVVGQQPVLRPGESYEYESACNLNSELGSMHGVYTFIRQKDDVVFEVEIPRFELIANYRLN